ncbi:MAG: hypothetical protein IKW09_02265 [Alphaproteobacteria bacterium]|nr:hypothetical protein [Alphaproteobacteria bacterium]
MKTRTFIFSSLLCLCGTLNAHASECVGAGCDVAPLVFEEFEWIQSDTTPMVVPAGSPTAIVVATPTRTPEPPTWMDTDPNAAVMPVAQNLPMPIRNIDVKMLSIKPVPEDRRPALWDGVHGKYTGPDADKTVDWKNGIPIWDESINSYRYKDFTDWFLEASPEIYVREVDPSSITNTSTATVDPIALYQQNMEDAATTRARVEELLAPRKPSANLWFANMPVDDNAANTELTLAQPRPEYVAQDMTEIVVDAFGPDAVAYDDGCPFETETECQIWRRKPIVRETVSPRSAKLRDAKMAEFIHAADCNKHIQATDPAAAPLLDRYKMLMRSAQACCTDGMAYALKQAGASDGLVYKFLSDDANFYGFGSRCLMMTDHDLDSQYPNTATAVVAADVRNGCLCRGRQWFAAMLAPFQQAYQALPEFKDAQFNYTYKDGLQREITVSINNDVQNVLKQLAQCP